MLEPYVSGDAESLATFCQLEASLPFNDPLKRHTRSIVERETGVAKNARAWRRLRQRLRRGMRSNRSTEPTRPRTESRYVRSPQRIWMRAPYNTYRIGICRGPLATLGGSTAATLNPLETDEFYFVADGTGGHAFAKTLAEHNRSSRMAQGATRAEKITLTRSCCVGRRFSGRSSILWLSAAGKTDPSNQTAV